MKKTRLQELAGLNETSVPNDHKDGQIIYVALVMAFDRLMKLNLSSDEKGRLARIMKDFETAYGEGASDQQSSPSGVDAMANQLDKR